MPAVSVITPAYNVEPYLGEAIASVLAQTFTDLEIVIIDDGSTDATFEIASEYARRDARVRLVRQTNGGISKARNQALRIASGGVFAILDSDDVWHPAYLERQLAILDEHPDVDIVTGNAWFLGGPHDGQPARPCPDGRAAPELPRMLEDETAVFIMSVFRRRVYDLIGGFDESLRTNEDYDFWLRAAIAGCRFWRNDEPLGWYRRRDDSLSAGEVPMLRGIIRVFQKTRPAVIGYPAELALLDKQLARFETARLAAEARAAIEAGDFDAASDHLAALHSRRGGAALGIAHVMARWTPALLAKVYGIRRARLAQAASGQGGTP
jgi:glycosyltransferase involved in cell wall biosynthesis